VGEQRLLAEDLDAGVGGRPAAGQEEQQAGGRGADRHIGFGVARFYRDAGGRAGDQPLPRAFEPGIGGVEMQGLAVAAQLGGPGRVGGAGHDEAEPFVHPVGGEPGGQVDVPAGRELGVGQVHGGLVRPAAGPPAGRPRAGERPHRVVAGSRDGFGDQVGALGQPRLVLGRVVRQPPVRYLAGGDRRGRAGGHDLGRPPVAASDVGGQLAERPPRAGRHRPFEITVDDPGEFGGAAAELGEEAVIVTHRHPPHDGSWWQLLVAACR
jgi:hypothetical protein